MMILNNKLNDDFIKLFISGITDKVFELNDVDVDKVCHLAKYHSVNNIIYYGLKNHKLDIPEKLSKENFVLLHKMVTQDSEKELLKEEFNNKKLNYILVKGSMLRDYYPNPELREMGDMDILIDKKQTKEVFKTLEDLGYEYDHKDYCHVVYIKKPFVSIEAHLNLFDSYNIVSKYYDHIWEKASRVDGTTEYQLNSDETYMYLLTHAAKHFNSGGTGIRILADMYFYMKKHQLNFEYIDKYLNKYSLKDFSNVILSLSSKLFEGIDLTEDEMIILEFLLNSGTYGTIANRNRLIMAKLSENELQTQKKKGLLGRMFPSYKKMEKRNPSLKKFPFLLPWFWFTRLLKGLFNFKSSKNEYNYIMNTNNEEIKFLKEVVRITKVNHEIDEE